MSIMADNHTSYTVEERLLEAIEHHIKGWRKKISDDFSKENYLKELNALKGDPVYRKFAFDTPEYVLVRLIGRMSISIGRRLGEIYDTLPRYAASARYNIDPSIIAEKFNGLELDISLRFDQLKKEDADAVRALIQLQPINAPMQNYSGLGIEIRYNFNPNDSARLRKDVQICKHLKKSGLLPVYLIYSSISPRDDAISRLERAGWFFITGNDAELFTNALFDVDFLGLLERPDVKKRIRRKIRTLLRKIYSSEAFKKL